MLEERVSYTWITPTREVMTLFGLIPVRGVGLRRVAGPCRVRRHDLRSRGIHLPLTFLRPSVWEECFGNPPTSGDR
jgi:hypothetical protein